MSKTLHLMSYKCILLDVAAIKSALDQFFLLLGSGPHSQLTIVVMSDLIYFWATQSFIYETFPWFLVTHQNISPYFLTLIPKKVTTSATYTEFFFPLELMVWGSMLGCDIIENHSRIVLKGKENGAWVEWQRLL